MPWGVRIRARKPDQISTWHIPPKFPWEGDRIDITCILREGDTLKAWGHCSGGFCYLESEDGFDWKRPKLGLVDYMGSKKNNLIPSAPPGQVFIDPTSDSERYKCVYVKEGDLSLEELEAFKKKHPDRWGPRVLRSVGGKPYIICLWGWVSPDGFHWKQLPEPVLMEHCDTFNVGYYDTRLKKYVAYVRTWNALERAPQLPVEENRWDYWLSNGRRAIGRSESEDFRSFPRSQMIVEPGPNLSPSDQIYTNCFTWIPKAPDQFLMFPAIWHVDSDSTSIALLSSADGKNWHWVPGGYPLLETGPFGRWDGGCIWAQPPLFERRDGSFALMIRGDNFPHKYPRGYRKTEYGLAVWNHGRITALEAPEQGEFGTVAIVSKGQKLFINALTKRTGWIRVAVQKGESGAEIVPEHAFEECVPIVGDRPHAQVRWKNAEDLGVEPGEPVILLFKLKQASIYSLEFE